MTSRSFEISAAARLDLLEIWNWLAENSSLDTADRVLAELEEAMNKLARTPSLGHRRPDLTRKAVLFHLVHSWMIVYRPRTQAPHVLRVPHASRNVKKLLKGI